MVKGAIICVDDEDVILEALKEQLKRILSEDYLVETALSGKEALEIAEELSEEGLDIPLVITDHIMPEMKGDRLIIEFHKKHPRTLNILLTGRASAEDVGNIINHAQLYRYLAKPWEEADLTLTVNEGLRRFYQDKKLEELYAQAQEEIESRKIAQEELKEAFQKIKQLKEQLQSENIYLRAEIREEQDFSEIVGKSDSLQYVLYKLRQVAPTDTTVLILGETGTGKELIARAIHENSERSNRPLIKVNCAALPADLLESELFGHEKGAFTGAVAQKTGRFELAHKGTLFLDEIGELPLNLQAKLLQAIEYGEFERIGNPKTIKVDVRIIAATNRNLEQEIKEGHFRKDLYYRLNVYPLSLPSLRKRKEDIPLLVEYFVKLYNQKLHKKIEVIPQKTMEALVRYSWPGNIREMKNLIERAVILSKNKALVVEIPKGDNVAIDDFKPLEEFERDYIVRVLEFTNGKIHGPDGAAHILGLNESTLRSRMKKLSIVKSKPSYDKN